MIACFSIERAKPCTRYYQNMNDFMFCLTNPKRQRSLNEDFERIFNRLMPNN